MGLLGKLFSLPFKAAKTVAEVGENVVDSVTGADTKGTVSEPLEDLADEIEELDE